MYRIFQFLHKKRYLTTLILFLTYFLVAHFSKEIVAIHKIPLNPAVAWGIHGFAALVALTVFWTPVAVMRTSARLRRRAAAHIFAVLDEICEQASHPADLTNPRQIDGDLLLEIMSRVTSPTSAVHLITPSAFYLIADRLLPKIQESYPTNSQIRVRAETSAAHSPAFRQALINCPAEVHFVLPDFDDDPVRITAEQRAFSMGIKDDLFRDGVRQAIKTITELVKERNRKRPRRKTFVHLSPIFPLQRIVLCARTWCYIQRLPRPTPGAHDTDAAVTQLTEEQSPFQFHQVSHAAEGIEWLLK